MTNPKRYSLEGYGHSEAIEMEDPSGEWVRYDDIKHLLHPESIDLDFTSETGLPTELRSPA